MLLPQESMLPQTKATGLSNQGLKIETMSQNEPVLLWIVSGLTSNTLSPDKQVVCQELPGAARSCQELERQAEENGGGSGVGSR